MSNFQAGYASINVNPPLGYPLHGYYLVRVGQDFLDDIEASALALTAGEETAILVSVDNGGFQLPVIETLLDAIVEKTGVKRENVIISATHSHTAPSTFRPEFFDANEEHIVAYIQFLAEKLATVSAAALADRKPAKMGYATATAPDRIAYIRRYRMKDGSTCTCPPIDDENIDSPIGSLDQRVHVLRFDRDGADSVVILNYGVHADTVNGDKYCSDWIGWTRRTLEKALDGTKCMCIVGAQGDVGSTNVHPLPGDMNDTEISFDNEMKSFGMARFVGRALAGTVLQVYDKVAYIPVEEIRTIREEFAVNKNTPSPEEMPLARKYKELYESGRSDEIPYTGMELTTVVAEALRMCKMEKEPAVSYLPMTGIRIGEVALVTIPGEPFTDIGVQIKDTEGYALILPCAITGGYEGYFPMKSAFDEGGYEARTSPYKGDIAETIVTAAKRILGKLRSL